MIDRPSSRRTTSTSRAAITVTFAAALLGALSLAACSGSDAETPNAATDTLAPLTSSAPPTVAAASSTSSTSTTSPTISTTIAPQPTLPPETTTTFPFVNQGATVIVANAADVPGAATRYTTALTEYGFALLEPTNGAGPEEIIDVTRIYARPDPVSQAVALSVARLMGELPVERMPTPAPISDATLGLGEATVLVMLGRDLADQPLPGPPTP